MSFGEEKSHYEVLDIPPDATPQEIREAYVRLKNTFSKGSAALYSLVSENETRHLLEEIENAYQVLSSPEKREAYNENFRAPNNKVVSLEEKRGDLVFSESNDDLLVVPSTDFGNAPRNEDSPNKKEALPPSFTAPDNERNPDSSLLSPEAVREETVWPGGLLKKIRESQKISIEEMSEFTKVTKRYLRAIEEENFPELPASVYLRGFLVQYAKKLGLPSEKVASAYVERYRKKKASA